MTAHDDERGTRTWRSLWEEAGVTVGDRTVARWLCEEAAGLDGADFLDELDRPATQRMVHHLDEMVVRLQAGEPVQYVLGHWPFRRLDLLVDQRVLIPRPETELLVERAIACLREEPRPLLVADLGTGSGAIGLALATELRHDGMEVWLTDAVPDALDVARANVAGAGRAGAHVRVALGDWFEALPASRRGAFDLIVANPPYVADDDPALEAVVRGWEPSTALFGGLDGLDEVRVVVAGAITWLRPGGWLLVEIGADQREPVLVELQAAGYDDAAVLDDLAGRPRIAVGRRPRP